jgi:hypothetical protein
MAHATPPAVLPAVGADLTQRVLVLHPSQRTSRALLPWMHCTAPCRCSRPAQASHARRACAWPCPSPSTSVAQPGGLARARLPCAERRALQCARALRAHDADRGGRAAGGTRSACTGSTGGAPTCRRSCLPRRRSRPSVSPCALPSGGALLPGLPAGLPHRRRCVRPACRPPPSRAARALARPAACLRSRASSGAPRRRGARGAAEGRA